MSKIIKFDANYSGLLLNIALFLLYVVIAVLSIIMSCYEIHIVSILINNGSVTLDDISGMLNKRAMLSNATIITYIACRSLFLNWAYYVQRNLNYFNITNVKFNTWRLVFAFVVPIANFYLPIVIINQIWQGSDPKLISEEEVKAQHTNRLIILWWVINLIWIALSVFNNVAKVMVYQLPFIKALGFSTIVSDCLGILVMLSTIFLMVKVYRRQQQKYRLFSLQLNCGNPDANAK